MGYKILLVDDERMACSYLGTILKSQGYEVSMAYNGNAALKIAVKEEPDIIILDIEMPDKSGMEVCENLLDAGISSAFIFLTAHAKIDYTLEAIKLGVEDYVLKPINNINVLLSSIQRVIRSLELKRKIKLYENILPVCCKCRKIRDDTDCEPGTGKWMTMEAYLSKRAKIDCSHGYCTECYEDVMKTLNKRKR